MVEKGYLERRLAHGGQVVTIMNKGLSKLRKEFSEYELIFGKQKEIEMSGALETGLGEGGYYISKKGYMTQFEKKLGWKPFEGTFNLRLKEEEVPKIEAMKAADGILIEGFEQEGRTFGKAWVFKCTLNNGNKKVENCAIQAFQSHCSCMFRDFLPFPPEDIGPRENLPCYHPVANNTSNRIPTLKQQSETIRNERL